MELQQYDELTFENIKHIDENGVEFCSGLTKDP